MLESEDMKQEEPEIKQKDEKPGEYIMLALILVITGALLSEAFKLKGLFQGSFDNPGVLPQIILISMLFLIIIIAVQLYKGGYRAGKLHDTIRYLFCRDVVFLIIAVAVYAFLLEKLHFEITTLLFLWFCMFMFDRRRPLNKLFISVSTLVVIIAIFSKVFLVLLP